MSIWTELKERRITQVVLTYLAGGWILLVGVDQLVSRQILPELAYRLALVAFAGGLLGALVLGWYHGEKGRQKVTLPEAVLLTVVILATGVSAAFVARTHLERERLAEAGGIRGGIVSVPGALDPTRIAVLYFEDRSREGDLGHMADGLTEALIAELASVRALDVVSANGVLPFRDVDLPRDSVARALSAGTVVTGSVELLGGRIRVGVAVYDGESGAEFRRERLDRSEDELLELSEGVAIEVSRMLRRWLGEEVELRRRTRETDDAAAWALLQRGERARKEAEAALGAGDTEEALRRFFSADSFFAAAGERDPSWARPPTSRGQIRARIAQRSASDPVGATEQLRRGLEHMEAALELDPRFAPAFEGRGLLRYLAWRLGMERGGRASDRLLASAEEDLITANRLDPSLATAWNVRSVIHAERSDPVNAKLAAVRAYEADTYLRAADNLLWRLFSTSYDLEQFPDAVHYCREGGGRFPDHDRFAECELWLLASRALPADVDRAWELYRRYLEVAGVDEEGLWGRRARIVVGGVIARAGLPDSANTVFLSSRLAPDLDPHLELQSVEAVFRLQMGEEHEALDLIRSYLTANPQHRDAWQWSSHWWWRPLQANPDFRDLVGNPAE